MRDLKSDKDKLWVTSEKEEDLADITDLDELERLIFEEEEENQEWGELHNYDQFSIWPSHS